MATSMFSKRHYEAVAAIINRANDCVAAERPFRAGCCENAIRLVRDQLADLFEADNPQDGKGRGFKRDKWEEACER